MLQNRQNKSSGKKLLSAAIDITVFVLLMYIVFHKHYREILSDIKSVTVPFLLLLLSLGILYFLLDSAACKIIISCKLPNFSYREALEVTALGVFCGVATFSAGILPAQTYYLYRRGLAPGDSLGLLIIKYINHKCAIVLFSLVILIFNSPGIFAGRTDILMLSRIGWALNGVITVLLFLLCRWEKVRQLAEKLILLLPSSGKWPARKASLEKNLNALYAGIRSISGKPRYVFRPFIFNIAKLAVIYCIPYIASVSIGCRDITFGCAFSLTGLMNVIATAMPNVAGMGPTEASFLIIFNSFVPQAKASAMLVLYRISTCFFPFIISTLMAFFIKRQRRNIKEEP